MLASEVVDVVVVVLYLQKIETGKDFVAIDRATKTGQIMFALTPVDGKNHLRISVDFETHLGDVTLNELEGLGLWVDRVKASTDVQEDLI